MRCWLTQKLNVMLETAAQDPSRELPLPRRCTLPGPEEDEEDGGEMV